MLNNGKENIDKNFNLFVSKSLNVWNVIVKGRKMKVPWKYILIFMTDIEEYLQDISMILTVIFIKLKVSYWVSK